MQYGLIGEKLGHSYSKELHNQIGSYDYILKEIPKDKIVFFLKEKEFKAINVTIPYKETVIPYLDYVDHPAQEIGAVNTIVNKNGSLYGYNTDFWGLKDLIEHIGLNLEDKNVLILGTGGTSKTSISVAKALKARSITIASRTNKDCCISYENLSKRNLDIHIIINATPCGMYPDLESCPIDLNLFSNLEGVVDVIYNPLRSRLVLEAQKRNIKAEGGLFMLVRQAIRASEYFFEKPCNNCDDIYKNLLREKQNIVLCGMPGCGKSTVAKILAKNLNREFFDTDLEIENLTKKHPSQIIRESGEAYFREIEKNVCKSLASKTGCIIATGGGVILKEENVMHLKNNGIIFFLDRDISEICVTDSRPLSSTKEKLQDLYNKRYELYLDSSDYVIKVTQNAEKTAKEIQEVMYEN